jgi:hypothetical protein
VLWWQAVHGLPDGSPVRFPLQVLLRAARDLLAVLHDQEVQLGGRGRPAPLVAGGDAARPVAGDGAEPAREAARVLELRKRLEGQQERFLRDVFSGSPRPQHLLRHGPNGAPEPPHQLIVGREVPDEGADHELLVRDLRIVNLAFRQ